MNTAFYVSVKWSQPRVTEFRYTKKTAQYYTGCEVVGHIVGSGTWLASRIEHADVRETLAEALARVDAMLIFEMQDLQARVNSLNSRRGEVAKIARSLGINL